MIRSISAEWLKLRHSRIVLLLGVLPVVSLLIGCANFYANQSVLGNGWYSLWTQVSLFYGEFFLPILIAICCSYLSRLEHGNRNWNMTMSTPISPSGVFFAKWFVAGMLILFAQVLFALLYWLAGTLLSLDGSFPAETIGWIIRGWYASLAIGALQLGLSLKMRSFATPIGICLCAVFAGLGLYVAKLGLFFPYSLLTIGMGVLSQDQLNGLHHVLFWVCSTGFIVAFAAMSISRLKRLDW
ncbi:ABC transporter permease [Paenibacillus sp. CAU 1782]